MCHAMFIDEINNCVIFYLSNDACAKALNMESLWQLKQTHQDASFSPIRQLDLIIIYKILLPMMFSTITPILTCSRVHKIDMWN